MSTQQQTVENILNSDEFNSNHVNMDNTIYYNRNTLIIGKRSTGKTSFVIHEIYSKLQHMIDNVFLISTCDHILDEYNIITDKIYNPKELDVIYNNISHDHDKKSLIIIEDIGFSKSILTLLDSILSNGCNLNTSVVIVSERDLEYPHSTRKLINNYIIANDNYINNIQNLYHNYFNNYQNFNVFENTILHLKPYEFLCKTWKLDPNTNNNFIRIYKVNITNEKLRFIKSTLNYGKNQILIDIINQIMIDIKNQQSTDKIMNNLTDIKIRLENQNE